MRVVCVLLSVIGLFAPLPALAQEEESGGQLQEPPPDARREYELGLRAMDDGRWADALRAFQRSYRIHPAPAALFNQGVVLRSLGRMREARDAFASVMADHPEAPEDVRAAADDMGREVAAEVAELELIGLPPPTDDLRLRLDGDTLDDDGSRPLAIEIDPGDHALTVLLAGHEPFEWEDGIGPGERRRVRVELEGSAIPIWAWIAGGAGVAIGVILVVLLLATETSDDTQVLLPEVAR